MTEVYFFYNCHRAEFSTYNALIFILFPEIFARNALLGAYIFCEIFLEMDRRIFGKYSNILLNLRSPSKADLERYQTAWHIIKDLPNILSSLKLI